MSANNYIKIKELDKKKYSVDECDADTDQPYSHLGTCTSIEDAIITANEATDKAAFDGYEIEYGLVIELIDGQ